MAPIIGGEEARVGFRWRIVPMTVCGLGGAVMVIVGLGGSLAALWNNSPQGWDTLFFMVLGVLGWIGLSGLLLIYSAQLWRKGRWRRAAVLTSLGGLVLPLVAVAFVVAEMFYEQMRRGH
jgi:hypothetical protein